MGKRRRGKQMSFAITKECQVAHLQPEVAPFQRYRMLAVQHRECAQRELLPNARRVLEGSAECWEILAERHEAAARCAAEVHVTSSAVARSPSPRGPEPARVGKLVFDLARRIVRANGARIRLTDQEYAILDCLRLKQGATASKETLLDYLYPRNDQPDFGKSSTCLFANYARSSRASVMARGASRQCARPDIASR